MMDEKFVTLTNEELVTVNGGYVPADYATGGNNAALVQFFSDFFNAFGQKYQQGYNSTQYPQ